MNPIPLLALVGGIVSLDTTAGPQVLISEPIISCTAVGIILGDPQFGFMFGLLFQLLWIGYLPLGGIRFIDSNMGSFCAAASAILASRMMGFPPLLREAVVIPAVLIAAGTGYVGDLLREVERRLDGAWIGALLARVESGESPSIGAVVGKGLLTAFIKGVALTVVFIPIGTGLCMTVAAIPDTMLAGMIFAARMVWGLCAASAVYFFWKTGRRRYLLVGTLFGVLWVFIQLH